MKDFYDNIKNSKNGNAIVFFGMYALFFVALILFLRFGRNGNYAQDEYEPGNTGHYRSDYILKNNYFFDYKVKIDGVTHDYYGKRNGNYELFKYNNHDYYRDDYEFFVDNNGLWNKCDNPYKFYEFINIEKSGYLIEDAYLLSTNYDDNKRPKDYTYLISSNTINKVLYDIDSDYDDVANQVVLEVDEKKFVNKITFKLNSFCKSKGICQNDLEIILSYEMFGEVKKIDNPVG